MFAMLAQITWQQWRQHRLRTGLTILGIALGVAVFFAVRTANVTLLSSLTITIEKLAGKTTLQVTGGEAGFPENVWDHRARYTGRESRRACHRSHCAYSV